MIQLLNLSLAFGGQQVLDGLTWTIKPGQRIGLIGPNGAGKSTLLRVIDGRTQPDEGSVSISGGTTIGYLEQDVQEVATDESVLASALQAFAPVLALEAEVERLTRELDAEADHTTERYDRMLHALERVQAQLLAHESHRIEARTEEVLAGLGFEADDMQRPLRTFSGGWRMRVSLARMLLREPDFLLLDEPTNHLDIESIDWLEGYLRAYRGTVVIVSHDRYFLDRMVTSIAELAAGKVTEYAGNYTYYLTAREERRAIQQAAYDNQQREIAEMERFVERFRAKATKAKQAQSRVKMLERMERLAPPPAEAATVNFRFPAPRPSGRTVLELSRFSKTYQSDEGIVRVFDGAGPLTIERGDKIALVGKNGAGKSTLARILNGTETFEGSLALGYHVERTFFAQHQAEALHPRDTIIASLRAVAPGKSDTEIRTLLGAFLFTGDDVFKPVGVLSGGEKSRVALARTLIVPANFMILDEPTNHLDIQSVGVLIEALRQYAGTFVIVSHDRHFLDQVVNRVWHAGHGEVRTFPGTYSEYQWSVQHGTVKPPDDSAATTKPLPAARPATAAEPERSTGPKTKEQKRREAEERARLRQALQGDGPDAYAGLNPYQLRKAYEKIEADILAKEAQQSALQARLNDPYLYDDHAEVQRVTEEMEAVQAGLAKLYETWEAIAGHLAAQEGA